MITKQSWGGLGALGGQSYYYEALGIHSPSGKRVRVKVRRDSYEMQSHAKAEVWTENGWAFVTYLDNAIWYELAPSSYANKHRETLEAMEAVTKQLFDKVDAVL